MQEDTRLAFGLPADTESETKTVFARHCVATYSKGNCKGSNLFE